MCSCLGFDGTNQASAVYQGNIEFKSRIKIEGFRDVSQKIVGHVALLLKIETAGNSMAKQEKKVAVCLLAGSYSNTEKAGAQIDLGTCFNVNVIMLAHNSSLGNVSSQ